MSARSRTFRRPRPDDHAHSVRTANRGLRRSCRVGGAVGSAAGATPVAISRPEEPIGFGGSEALVIATGVAPTRPGRGERDYLAPEPILFQSAFIFSAKRSGEAINGGSSTALIAFLLSLKARRTTSSITVNTKLRTF